MEGLIGISGTSFRVVSIDFVEDVASRKGKLPNVWLLNVSFVHSLVYRQFQHEKDLLHQSGGLQYVPKHLRLSRPKMLIQEKWHRAIEVTMDLAAVSMVWRAESICCLATERPSCWKV